jgi:hypothetical protein
MNIYEHYTDTDIEEIAFGISKVAHHLTGRKRAPGVKTIERTIPA